MPAKTAVHFGAGRIGRGLIVPSLRQNAFDTFLVEVNRPLLNALRNATSYRVTEFSRQGVQARQFSCEYAGVYHAFRQRSAVVQKVQDAELITLRAGADAVDFVASIIASGIQARGRRRPPLMVMCCERDADAVKRLERLVDRQLEPDAPDVKFIAAYAGRLVSEASDSRVLDLAVEEPYDWYVDGSALPVAFRLPLREVQVVKDFAVRFRRHSFVFHLAKIIAGYCAWDQQRGDIRSVLADRSVTRLIRTTLHETLTILRVILPRSEHALLQKGQKAYIQSAITRLANPGLSIKTQPITKYPLTNLRIIFSLLTLVMDDPPPKRHAYPGLLQCCAMVLRHQDVPNEPESEFLGRLMTAVDPPTAIYNILDRGDPGPLYEQVLQLVHIIQSAPEDPVSPGGSRCCVGLRCGPPLPSNPDVAAVAAARKAAASVTQEEDKVAAEEAKASKARVAETVRNLRAAKTAAAAPPKPRPSTSGRRDRFCGLCKRVREPSAEERGSQGVPVRRRCRTCQKGPADRAAAFRRATAIHHDVASTSSADGRSSGAAQQAHADKDGGDMGGKKW